MIVLVFWVTQVWALFLARVRDHAAIERERVKEMDAVVDFAF